MEEDRKKIQVQVRLKLAREEAFWGRGTEQIIQGILAGESVRDASRKSGISYSKARKIIANAEKGWGVSLVESQQGGKNGGISKVTEEGRKRAALFEELEKSVQEFAKEKYEELERLYFLESE